MPNFDALIEKSNSLRGVEVGSPRFAIWANDVRAAVLPYGDHMMQILEGCLTPSSYSMMGVIDTCDEQIDVTIEFLKELEQRSPDDSRAQDAIINQKQAEARATLQRKFGNITVHGDATFGDESPISKVTVGELISGIIKEVEGLPESDDKHKILDSLKATLTNPTFAAVSAAVASEVITKLMR